MLVGPGQAIRTIAPFTQVTGMDTIERTISLRLSERLGQLAVVQTVPGVSGNIAPTTSPRRRQMVYAMLLGARILLMAL